MIASNVKLLIEQLGAGHSEGLTAYLTAMGRFHNYSFGNILEIARQKPDATRVAGMYAWNSPLAFSSVAGDTTSALEDADFLSAETELVRPSEEDYMRDLIENALKLVEKSWHTLNRLRDVGAHFAAVVRNIRSCHISKFIQALIVGPHVVHWKT